MCLHVTHGAYHMSVRGVVQEVIFADRRGYCARRLDARRPMTPGYYDTEDVTRSRNRAVGKRV